MDEVVDADTTAAAPVPGVVKPLSEASGIGVKLCRTADEAAEHLRLIDSVPTDRRGHERPPGALVQEYLTGYEVSVELMHTGRGHQVIGVTDKTLGPHPHVVEVGHVVSSARPASTCHARS